MILLSLARKISAGLREAWYIRLSGYLYNEHFNCCNILCSLNRKIIKGIV